MYVFAAIDKRAERGVRAEGEAAAVATAHGPGAQHEAEEEDGPDQQDHDRRAAAVPGHGVPAGYPGPAQRRAGQVFLPHVLQPVWRAHGHAGPAQRLAELRVLLLHEQAISRGVRPAVPGPAQRPVPAQRHTRDVRVAAAVAGNVRPPGQLYALDFRAAVLDTRFIVVFFVFCPVIFFPFLANREATDTEDRLPSRAGTLTFSIRRQTPPILPIFARHFGISSETISRYLLALPDRVPGLSASANGRCPFR